MNDQIERAIDAVGAQLDEPAAGTQMVALPLRVEPIILQPGQKVTIAPPESPSNPNVLLREPDGTWRVVVLAPGTSWDLAPESEAEPVPRIWLPGRPS